MMPMRVEFTGNTADEMNEAVKDYASKIKGTRGGKVKDEDTATAGSGAPAPLAPPTGFQPNTQQVGFNPGGAAPQFDPNATNAAAFNPTGPSPEVQALVQRINGRIDTIIREGQPAERVLDWFRGQCGAEAANATMDQVKQHFLPRASAPTLENIAKLLGA